MSNGRDEKRLSGRSAIAFLVVMSAVGWLFIGMVVSLLAPNDASQIATDEEMREIQDFMPAAGGNQPPSK
ncbi:MAG: hypothetical protein KDE22_13890 [Rhodobacterales bacterium]|nr:hypothetical protein [Rhodobacterales bacterium]